MNRKFKEGRSVSRSHSDRYPRSILRSYLAAAALLLTSATWAQQSSPAASGATAPAYHDFSIAQAID